MAIALPAPWPATIGIAEIIPSGADAAKVLDAQRPAGLDDRYMLQTMSTIRLKILSKNLDLSLPHRGLFFGENDAKNVAKIVADIGKNGHNVKIGTEQNPRS